MPRLGDLDASFGTNGLVITDFGGSSFEIPTSVAIKSDGKIIVAGFTNKIGTDDFALAGYLSNGNLDASFGTNGLVITDLTGNNGDQAKSLAIKSDGKIIVAGYTNVNGLNDFALACYLSNGSLDASFGTNGLVIANFGVSDMASSVAIDPSNGKIIVAGYKDTDYALACYLPNGNLDASFGSNGLVITDFSGNDAANSVAIKPDGKIIAAGYTDANGSDDFALACYLPNGSLDVSFGTNGLVITNFGGTDVANSVAINPTTGNIIVAGYTNVNGSNNFALACYLSNGDLDTSFGTNGLVITNFGGTNEAYSVAIKPDGKIIVAGYNDSDFALACYLPNGSLDTLFGTNGKVITDFGGSDLARSVAINPTNGKIIVAGYTYKNGLTDFALACYFGEKIEVPISNVCFPANTLISTNQGNIAIQNLNPEIHTIRNKKIELITKTITQNKYLVCFEKDSLGKNLPSQKTIISKNHGIFYKGKMIHAKEFINKFENVKKIKYTGEILYNVLMEDHDKMMINNLICETLHPENGTAKLYKCLQNLNPKEQQNLVENCNEYSIKNNIFSSKR